ncbi:class A beta-lactamase [Comamonas kerstersii]|uniref:beta-lactamase n=1 Tax=Comamonas kerstersii TaxID=225992 RepID=A0A6A1R1U0_9BURK|nr:class A beta-lactamase [Comamonas kerstersii]KAB0586321.1 class A beta-lactamase [Comamonas kerstersii]
MLSRRLFTTSACLTLLAGCASAKTDHRSASLQAHCQALEAKAQGRLGVSIVDTATGQQWGWREDERFMMLSSFKLLASALVLHRVDQGQESLQRRMAYPRSALIPWSPITEKHADGPGLTLGELCAATITTSDNTAGNLILESYGGPAALTAYARQLGDAVTRLDRNEPTLNRLSSDGLLDTTSPRAMAQTMHKLLVGEALSTASRQQLRQWLLANTTGGKRLKAGVPASWQVGDKTGTNATDANDIGFLIPPQGAPWIVTAYLAGSSAEGAVKDACLADVAAWVAAQGA